MPRIPSPFLVRAGLILQLSMVCATAQSPDPPAEEQGQPSRWSRLEQQAQQFIEKTRKLGNWNEHYQYGQQAAQSIFERYGFTSESDQFALEVMRAVESKPPWMIQERLDTAMSLFARRYGLDEDQKATMQDIFLREATGMVSRNAEAMFEVAGEMLESRSEGRPFSAEQVARISERARPMLQDGQESLRRATEDMKEILSPEQQEKLTRDIDAAFHRMETIQKETYRWSAGEWSPEDWGLGRDPIQSGEIAAKREAQASRAEEAGGVDATAAAEPKERVSAPVTAAEGRAGRRGEGQADAEPAEAPPAIGPKPAATPRPTPAGELDRHPWAVHVREFVAKYQLDEEQQQKAWLMYSEARVAAPESATMEVAKAGKSKPAAAGVPAAGSVASRKLARQFEALKRRLERLPTRAQRARVAEASSRPARPAGSAPARP